MFGSFPSANDIPHSWQKMMKGVSCLWRTRSMLRPEAEYWVDESERIVLVGEAAHPAYVS